MSNHLHQPKYTPVDEAAWLVMPQYNISHEPTSTTAQPKQPTTDPVLTHARRCHSLVRVILSNSHGPRPALVFARAILCCGLAWPSLAQPTSHLAPMHTSGYYSLGQADLPPGPALTKAGRCSCLAQSGIPPSLVLVLISNRDSLARQCVCPVPLPRTCPALSLACANRCCSPV